MLKQKTSLNLILTTAVFLGLTIPVFAGRPSGYAMNSSLMRRGGCLEYYYRNPLFENEDYHLLVVFYDEFKRVPDNSSIDERALKEYLARTARQMLKESGLFDEVYPSTAIIPSSREDEPVLELRLTITALDQGNRFKRVLLNSSPTYIQVEGRIVDAKTKQEFIAFSDGRLGMGFTDISRSEADAIVRADIRDMIACLINTLRSSRI